MNFLSVCSGIEAASVAWKPLGFDCIGVSEIESFPCSVLAHRFPDVPNFGDMNNFEEWPIESGSVDILVGGTPCQSFSIAGLRGGLEDDRGNLALTYCRILQKFRPRWFVWENVPGVLSSNEGRDFGSILGAMEELGYGIAYRVLDAQYFGVPQRRRRVFVVGCAGDWRRAAEVLFEPGCLRGDSQKGGKKKSAVAALTANGVGTCGADDNQGQAGHLIPSITSHYGKGVDSDCTAPMVTHSLRADGFDASEDGTGRGTPLIAATLTSGSSSPKAHGKKNGTDRETLIPVAFNSKTDAADYGETSPTLLAMSHSGSHANAGGQVAVAFSGRNRGDDGRGYDRPPNITGNVSGTVDSVKPGNVAGPTIGVRRLTVEECESLQGFPRYWTLVPHRGKPAADGPRYKAIGNSMAVPVMRWIGERILSVENNNEST